MSDGTVIFLGAGASKPLNYPLTYEILPLILGRLSSGTLFGPDNKKRASVQSILKVMFPGRDLLANRPYNNGSETMHSSSGEPPVSQANTVMNLPLVTDVLSLLDFMAGTGVAASPHMGHKPLDPRDRTSNKQYSKFYFLPLRTTEFLMHHCNHLNRMQKLKGHWVPCVRTVPRARFQIDSEGLSIRLLNP